MQHLPPINLISMMHLIFLCFWGGVVAAESVLELYPFRRREFHENCIEYHYWIDLLVELPLIICVISTGVVLVTLAWPMSGLHFIKIACALVAISANLVCVALVVQRRGLLKSGSPDEILWSKSRRIIICAAVGLPLAAVTAGMGFWLAYNRLLDMFL